MPVFSRPVYDQYGERVTLSDTDPELYAHDQRKAERAREQRRAAGIPEPTLAELAAGFGPHPHPSVCEVPDCWVPACRAWEWSEHKQAVGE
ncbi:hypothetical protein [Nocardioides sp. WS12]|uniref:hypothetical protein n=1 Tax=Nocardioides sp. WS12 TaxID=2486272 RepID=UPI0015F8DD26|nr:hypothetical protein [Nocardioides sp. WS12]